MCFLNFILYFYLDRLFEMIQRRGKKTSNSDGIKLQKGYKYNHIVIAETNNLCRKKLTIKEKETGERYCLNKWNKRYGIIKKTFTKIRLVS